MKENRFIIVLCAVSLLIRIVMSLVLYDRDKLYQSDAMKYDGIGWNLSEGRGFVLEENTPTMSSAPMYPMFLSVIYRILGHRYIAVRLAQIFISILMIVSVYLLGILISGRVIARIAAVTVAFYPAFLLYPNLLLTENLYIPILTLMMFLLYKGIQREKYVYFIISGLMAGICALTRVIIIFFPLIVLVALLLNIRGVKKGLIYFFLFSICMSIAVAPWIRRNMILFGKFNISLGLGTVLWSASYAPWDGIYKGGTDDTLKDIEANLGSRESSDDYLLKEALRTIISHPAKYIMMSLRKLPIFWMAGHTSIWGLKKGFNEYFINGEYVRFMLKIVLTFLHNLLLILGIMGFLRVIGCWRRYLLIIGLIAYYSLSGMFLTSVSRHHLPAMPFIFIFTAIAIEYYGGKFLAKFNISNLNIR